jgi:hypothetical protein
MMHDNRIKYFAPADYSENAQLDNLAKAIIDRTVSNEALESIHYANKKKFEKNNDLISAEQKERRDLLISLENSSSFAATHTIIAQLIKYNSWADIEKDWLIDIADSNSQVWAIPGDVDVKNFYKSVLAGMKQLSDKAAKIKEKTEK